MFRNRVSFDKYLMATFLGLGMFAAGMSSTDKGWAVIGAIILVVTLSFGGLDIYLGLRKSGRSESRELPTPVLVALCIIAVPALAAWWYFTGDVTALLIAIILVILLIVLFLLRNVGPIKLAEISTDLQIPIRPGDDPSAQPIKVMIGDTEIPISQTQTTFSLPLNVALKAADLPFFRKEGSYLSGIVQAMKGDTEAALGSFRSSAGVGELPELAAGRAVALISGRRYEEALAEIDRGIAESPAAILRLLRGQVLLAIGATQEALSEIEASSQGSVVAGLKGMLGAAYLEVGRFAEAITALREAGDEITANSGTFFTLAGAYRLNGQSAEAADAYEEAAARAIVDAQYAVAVDRGVLPMSLARLGRLDAAEEAVGQALSATQDDPTVRIARALIEVKRGTPSFAPSDLEEALNVNPHAVVRALEDPDFAPIRDQPAVQALLERAKAARGQILQRVNTRVQSPGTPF